MSSSYVGYLASGVSGQTPLIGRKTGRLPKRTQKDGGRGSGSPLTRAFAGSKPLLIVSLPATGHPVLTLFFGDGLQVRRIDTSCPLLAQVYGILSCVPWT